MDEKKGAGQLRELHHRSFDVFYGDAEWDSRLEIEICLLGNLGDAVCEV
jgi:hypothetical protein